MKKIITASLVGTLLVTGTSTVVNAQTQSQQCTNTITTR